MALHINLRILASTTVKFLFSFKEWRVPAVEVLELSPTTNSSHYTAGHVIKYMSRSDIPGFNDTHLLVIKQH